MLASQGLLPVDASGKEPTPFLKWAGGKSQVLDQLKPYFPTEFRRYFEPFLGGGAVFFHLQPKRAVISDANFELVNVYKIIAKRVNQLVDSLADLQHQTLTEDLYYEIREQGPEKLNEVERATRFIFLNKTCYNGLYRVNSDGRFNVPFGKYEKMPRLYDESNLRSASSLLKSVDIDAGYYNIVLKGFDARRGDFVYLDPPYAVENGNGFTSYTKEVFSWPEQERLAKEFKRLMGEGCQVMLSNSDTQDVRKLYSHVAKAIIPIKADRMINRIGKERTGYKELIILSYQPEGRTLKRWIR